MDNLIYDRTQEDVLYALNNPSSENFLKGAYNYTDLNRIENWCSYIADILNSYNYPVEVTVKTNWSMTDFPIKFDMERIRQNVNRLKQAYFSFTQIPENLEYMTWRKANDIEKILYELDYILRHMENNFIYSGVARSGQNRIWQQRFRRIYTYIILKTWEELTQLTWNDFADDETWKGVGEVATNHEL